MYLSEKVFIMRFIAGLKKLGVSIIPFDNDDFYKGARKMNDVFQEHYNEMGKYASEIEMLFLQDSIGGTFTVLRDEIARQNGELMSFENPLYRKAEIKMDNYDVYPILNLDDFGVSSNQILDFSRAFCDGAGIKYESVETL